MRIVSVLNLVACFALFLLWGMMSPAQTLYTNSFNTSVNYLTNGIAGTIWDGVYFGAGEFNNTGIGGGGPGATLQCDANITAAGTLTLQTTGTAWEAADDDGFFLFKVVPGDFSASVHVVSPFDASDYNTAGLQARAFSAGGDPFNGSENFVSWTRFDEYGFANYLRNEVNGGVAQINPGNYPNANYWLRMDRVNGTNFYFYEKATKAAAWQSRDVFRRRSSGTKLVRADLAGQPLQVGIIHATFNGQLGRSIHRFHLERFQCQHRYRAVAAVGIDAGDQHRERPGCFLAAGQPAAPAVWWWSGPARMTWLKKCRQTVSLIPATPVMEWAAICRPPVIMWSMQVRAQM